MPFIEVPDRIPGIRAQARGDQPWYRFKNVAADEAELFLYNEIGGFGTYAEDFLAELKTVTAPRLRVKVNSPGGSVFEGLALANALRSHPAEVTVQVDGLAASIASVIAMAADRVVVQPQAMLMVHDAAGACLGNAQDMTDMAALLDKISGNIADAYAAKAGGTRDEWRARMVAETWFTAEEAVAAGLADEVMTPPKKRGQSELDGDEPEMRRRYDLTAYGYQGPPPPKPEPSLTFNLGEEFGAQLLAMLRKDGVSQPAVAVSNVLRQFDEGDRVRVVGQPHEPGHSEGVVAVVNGNAYGIIFDTLDDDTTPGEPYLWYVDNELEFVAEGADRDGEGYGEQPEPEEPAEPEEEVEPLLPGVSHPMGRPIPTGAADTDGIENTACPVHHTATEDRPWDAGPNEKRLPSPMTVKTAKAMYAWYDDSQVTDGELPKAACKLPHHEVTADGRPGPANLSGVRNALARLPQSDIPAAQHDAVRRHLQAHLDDAKSAADNHETEWAAIVAHLTEPDPWSQLTSHLFNTASSSAATEAA